MKRSGDIWWAGRQVLGWGVAHSEPGQRRGKHADWPVRLTWVRNGPTVSHHRTGVCIRFGTTAFYLTTLPR